jgi:hypothetical protein
MLVDDTFIVYISTSIVLNFFPGRIACLLFPAQVQVAPRHSLGTFIVHINMHESNTSVSNKDEFFMFTFIIYTTILHS